MFNSVDCDIHPAISSARDLVPYLDPYWRDMVEMRGIGALHMASYPPTMPLSARTEWSPPGGLAGSDIDRLRSQALEDTGADRAICNLLFGGPFAANPHYAAALCGAMNDWMVEHCFAEDPRLSGSIAVALNNVPAAVDEIERRAHDPRFVQVLLFVGSELPLGRMEYWPVYAAAERHDLTIGIHAGSAHRHAPTGTGWPSYRAEDYANMAAAFEAQLMNLIAEGVFGKFPRLRVVMLESGVTWLPVFLWRYAKLWRGTRLETPWVDRSPELIVRDRVFLTLQPFDAPDVGPSFRRLCEDVGSEDMWLHASDYPHWQFDGADPLAGMDATLRRKVTSANPLRAYPRLERTLHG